MSKNLHLNLVVIVLVIAFGISACAGGNRANLKRIKSNKEMEKRENWNNYEVYSISRPGVSFQRGSAAFLYKLKDDKKILMDRRWNLVSTQEEKDKIKIFEATISAEILGHNQELYGYLIYRAADMPNVKIIDEQTVQIFYHYSRNYTN